MQPVRGADAVLPMAGPTVGSFGVGMGGIPGRKYSEDCLGLNIWTKPGNATPKAVLVWIHGGGKFLLIENKKHSSLTGDI
jgi:carboxylesterase type B